MDACGYQLRCLNIGIKCSECRNLNKDKYYDYLHDVLNVWPQGKDAFYAPNLNLESWDGYS